MDDSSTAHLPHERGGFLINGDAYGSPTGHGFEMVSREGTVAYHALDPSHCSRELPEFQWDLIVLTLLLLLEGRTLAGRYPVLGERFNLNGCRAIRCVTRLIGPPGSGLPRLCLQSAYVRR